MGPSYQWMLNTADRVALRTRFFDEAIGGAAPAGQFVNLGAGFDGRAFRLKELAEMRVFEVDHPATQGLKRKRTRALARLARELTFVPVDFERDSLDTQLNAAGHDPRAPTVWIWEGVVMFLTEAAFRATLRTVAERSAPGSTLIVQYNTQFDPNQPPARFPRELKLLFWVLGERFIYKTGRDKMAASLAEERFLVTRDESVQETGMRWNVPQSSARGNPACWAVAVNRTA